jgi:hypothetical protein
MASGCTVVLGIPSQVLMEVLYCVSAAFPALGIIAAVAIAVLILGFDSFKQAILNEENVVQGIILALDCLVIFVSLFAKPGMDWLLPREHVELQNADLEYQPVNTST